MAMRTSILHQTLHFRRKPAHFFLTLSMATARRIVSSYALVAATVCLIFTLLLVTSFNRMELPSSTRLPSQAALITSAYANLHARMRMIRSLQAAPKEQLKFLLVTGEQPTACKTKDGSHLLMMSLKNKVDYCNMHRCKVWYSLESWEPGYTGTWARYPLLKKLMLVNPNIEWFMWMDSDAMFTDMSFEIPLQTYSDWNKELVVPGYWEKIYGEDPDWLGLNAGIFLIRNTEWSRKLLEKWMRFKEDRLREYHTALLNKEFRTRPKDWPADDQSALAYLLRQNRTEHEMKTYLEAGYTLHGFWDVIVDKYEQMAANGNVGASTWPFITHFCGCKLCTGEYATAQTERCTKSFRRAYNFADNQVLALAGMSHRDLSSYEVEQTEQR